MPDISAFQAVTLAIAALGAVLGVINTWHGLDKTRVKLKVIPKRVIPFGGAPGNLRFCVEVVNLSSFAVSISEVGVFYHGTKQRGGIVSPVFADGVGQWPRRLEPRAALTVYSELPRSNNDRKIKCAFAKTECGRTITGTSPALRSIAADDGR